jgi:hypothetical protein
VITSLDPTSHWARIGAIKPGAFGVSRQTDLSDLDVGDALTGLWCETPPCQARYVLRCGTGSAQDLQELAVLWLQVLDIEPILQNRSARPFALRAAL